MVRQVTRFEASDGVLFEAQEDAEKHEFAKRLEEFFDECDFREDDVVEYITDRLDSLKKILNDD